MSETPPLAPGIYADLTNEEYHGNTASISRSAIMEYKKSPLHYWANYINPNRPSKKSTDEMIFGSAFHTAVLEPNTFMERYAIEPEKVLLKNVGEARYRAYKNECAALELSGKIVLSHEDNKKLIDMLGSLHRDIRVSELLSGGQNETSMFWIDDETGLTLKCRPDVWHQNMIVDLKTCANASYNGFQRAIVDGGYHIQGAMMREGVRKLTNHDIPNFICVAIEKTYPYAVGIHIIDEAALDVGREEFRSILAGIKNDIVYNKFESYGVNTIGLPRWYQY